MIRCEMLLLCWGCLVHPDPLARDQFWILTEKEVHADGVSLTMMCPAHKFGPPDEGYRQLQGILKDWPPGRLSSIWVCRLDQTNSLRRFAPLVDQVFINPFCHAGEQPDEEMGPSAGSPWPGVDHPVVNKLRQIRTLAPGKRLIACVDLDGEPSIFGRNRHACLNEVEWMVLAVIGANFQGLVWRRDRAGIPWSYRLDCLVQNLACFREDLGKASPSADTQANGGPCHVSVMTSESLLFLVLLHPEYMRLDQQSKVRLPVDPKVQAGEVTLTFPKGVAIEPEGTTVRGKRLSPRVEGERVIVPYCFSGGGEMLILNLKR